jgi:protein-disulfide isomerase
MLWLEVTLTQLDVYSAPFWVGQGKMKSVKNGVFAAVFAALLTVIIALAPNGATAAGAGPLPASQDMAIGDPKAPVTVIEYASMTCPHCAHFHNANLPDIKKKYIDTGKVRLIFREFPLDRAAFQASILARCSGADRFFPYINILFQQQANWARAEDQKTALAKLGQMGGVAIKDFDACLADKKLGDGILQTRKDGQEKFDIESTPSFVIDGKTLAGALDLATFSKAVDPLLK